MSLIESLDANDGPNADQIIQNLNEEIESLTMQVVNDFEELALLRSLAIAMPSMASDQSASDIVRRFLQPLAVGLNAKSLAAVLRDENESEIDQVLWSANELASDNNLARLVKEYETAARTQPIVVNNLLIPSLITDEPIKEIVLVECRSEDRLHGWLMAFNRVEEAMADQSWAQHGFTTVQASLLETATNQLAAQLHNARLFRQKESMFTDVVRALVNAVEARDPYTCGHSERVASFAKALARIVGQPSDVCERIYLTGLLHDVGKIAIPDGVLRKPGKLDADERAIIETHTDAGWQILHQLDALRDVLPGVLYHHEHFNGEGYPDGLAGDSIPLDGRILAVSDAFDAMTSDRPYRRGMPIEKACEILNGGSGSYWDPELVKAFVSHIDEIDQIRIAHRPRTTPLREKPRCGQPAFESVD